MSRYVIAKETWGLAAHPRWERASKDLPDAEHVHLTRHPDGTYTAVPMRRLTTIDAEGCGALVWDDTFDSDTDTAWTDAPVEDQP